MTSNKNQHYVPRCYLKPFTINGEGKAINVYNLERRKIITNAPVKNQCSRDYFYGQDDKLENAIQTLEQGYSRVLKEILTPGYQMKAEHPYVLQLFWLFQYLRTEGAGLRSAEMFADMLEPVNANGEFTVKIKEAVQAAMYAFAEMMDVVADLKICLLKNATSIPFLVSDDPAVLTNRWQLEDKRARKKSLGLRDAGAILLLPLSPKIYCLAYDPDVYRLPSDGGWLTVKKFSDVEILNEFQLINCRANLFVDKEDHAEYLHGFVEKYEGRRPATRHVINYSVFDGDESQSHERYRVVSKAEFVMAQGGIVLAHTISTAPSAWPSFLLRRHRSSAYYNGTAVGYVRHKHAAEMVDGQPFIRVVPYK